ncbi:DNA polymerase subunit Cdc27-like protein [Elsinoe fawcettii]|nr:DNA polymerase subunit Cdc27-like protein [Elsinoe fawcettii]
MPDYNEYLAIHVLNESQTISYRQLSRALKIHSSVAKQCLYDFHTKQNRKHAASIHASYLLTGLRNPPSSQTNHDGDNDVPMSSPYQSSQPSITQNETQSTSAPAPPTRVVLMASEAELEKAKATLDEVTSIHIYSLSPSPTTDLQTLTECNRKMTQDFYKEDPLESWSQYGVIQNPRVWRRTRKGAPVPPPEVPSITTTTKPPVPRVEEKEPAPSTTSSQKSIDSTKSASKPDPKPPALKKESSSLFKSFAKAKPPKPKDSQKEKEEDTTPALSDEEADDADLMDLDDGSLDRPGTESSKVDPSKSKREREEELRKMMDEDDEMVDADGAGKGEVEREQAEEADEAKEEEKSAPEVEDKGEVKVENGRRRGRRRVMKKRTVKDEEGYLVTKEEAAWESFSEEDVPPPSKKAKPSIMAQAAAKSTGDKGGKKGGKGQNSIMSFFAKK